MKHWVEKHYYDFEASPVLLKQLKTFVLGSAAKDPALGKAVTLLTKCVSKANKEDNLPTTSFETDPPEVIWFVFNRCGDFGD